MAVEKILIDLRQFWSRGKCLLKRHIPQMFKIMKELNLS